MPLGVGEPVVAGPHEPHPVFIGKVGWTRVASRARRPRGGRHRRGHRHDDVLGCRRTWSMSPSDFNSGIGL